MIAPIWKRGRLTSAAVAVKVEITEPVSAAREVRDAEHEKIGIQAGILVAEACVRDVTKPVRRGDRDSARDEPLQPTPSLRTELEGRSEPFST